MRKLTLMAVGLIAALAVFGQTKNVNKAKSAMDDGDLATAVELIEPATQNAKSAAKGHTWYVRGEIYKTIALSDEEATRKIDPNALDKAIESYKKVMSLEKEGSSDYGFAQMNLDQSVDFQQTGLAVAMLNKGVTAYQNSDFEHAYTFFIDLAKVNPTDTTGFLYGAISANQLEKYQDAVDNYKKVMDIGYKPKSVYSSIISLYLYNLKDYDSALKYIKEAKKAFPDENNFNKLEVDTYIKMEKLDEAISHLKSTIEVEPDNPALYINLGMLYAYDDKYDEAIENYKKGLELKPDDIVGIQNLADTYISKGNVYNKQASEMDIKTFTKEGDKVLEQAKSWYKKALPLLEKSNELKPDDKNVLSALNGLYIRLKMNDKAEEIYNRRVKLGYIDENK